MAKCRYQKARNCTKQADSMGLCSDCFTAVHRGSMPEWVIQRRSGPHADLYPAWHWDVASGSHGTLFTVDGANYNREVSCEQVRHAYDWEARRNELPEGHPERVEIRRTSLSKIKKWPLWEEGIRSWKDIEIPSGARAGRNKQDLPLIDLRTQERLEEFGRRWRVRK
ncbi:hypothetical protein DSL72_006272 [Monilinia vaccinii-corymbosi]|uniref:Uncharacterized protein n=1 Tax=Monilinia vaccinii-corymbosi TaxID=61207 RepID=A0A8A3PNI9_9HELO|nr:hypothetical protein DSL72_006272 [Monilinia vaccinii-corymbosi]